MERKIALCALVGSLFLTTGCTYHGKVEVRGAVPYFASGCQEKYAPKEPVPMKADVHEYQGICLLAVDF